MFILAKRSVLLPSTDYSQSFPVARGFAGEIPDWAADTRYFKELVQDGKIVVPESRKDKDLQKAAETAEPVNTPENSQKDSEESDGESEEKTKRNTKTK